MPYYLQKVWAVYSKDLRTEIRTKDLFSAMFVFSLLSTLVFAFALPGKLVDSVGAGEVAPGLLWVGYTFSGVLGLNRSFIIEKDRG